MDAQVIGEQNAPGQRMSMEASPSLHPNGGQATSNQRVKPPYKGTPDQKIQLFDHWED